GAGWPDEVGVAPGHTGGSLCGAGLSGDKVATIGAERLTNHALRIGHLEEFVAHSAAISAPRPPTLERGGALHRGRRPASLPQSAGPHATGSLSSRHTRRSSSSPRFWASCSTCGPPTRTL